MKSMQTLMREKIKNFLLLFDYIIWGLFDPCKFKKIKKEKIKKILIISLGAIGELLMLTPLLFALKKQLNCEISLMLKKGREEVLKNNPHVSEILIYDNSFKKNVEKLKKRHFDLAIIHYPVSMKIAFMCLFSKIKYRIGGISSLKSCPAFFITKKIFPIIKEHVVEEVLNLSRQIGIGNKNPRIETYVTKKEKQSVKNKLKKFKVEDYVIVHPGFGSSTKYKYPSRLWPLERYAKVADYLIEKYNFKILLTGGEDERKFSEEILKNAKNKNKVFITNGLFNFNELAFTVSKAKLVIAPGTSVIHIATAFNTPTIELIGKEDLSVWHPWMDKKRYITLSHQEVCTGCNLLECKKKTIECMKAISAEEVINASEELLNKKHS